MFKLKQYLKNYIKECTVAPLFKFLEAVFELVVPLLMSEIIDVGIKYGNKEYCYFLTASMCFFAILGLICSIVAQYFSAKAAHGYGTELRSAVFKKINSLSYKDVDGIGIPTLITRITSDINSAEKGINRFLRLFLRSPFIVIGAIISSMIINIEIGFIFLGVSLLLGLALYIITKITIPKNKKVFENLDSIALSARENLNGIRVVKAFAMQDSEEKAFKRKTAKLNKLQRNLGKISALLNPITYLLINLGIIAVLLFGGKLVEIGSLTQGQVSALINYMSQILLSLIVLASLIMYLATGAAATERIKELLDKKPSMQEGTLEDGEKTDEVLSFNSVGFKFGEAGNYVLQDVSFSVKRGEVVGIIGGTGSGKSTLVYLAERFYDATYGTIVLDNQDIKNYKFSALRKKFGVCFQKSVLFSGTVRDNIKLANENISDEEIIKALETAQAKDFVFESPLGLDKTVNEGGKNFSGGQRQRLCIARAIAAKPEILVLDDSFSALDYITDFKLRKALREIKGLTSIIISQRVESVRYADKIIVLDEGKVVGVGKHEKLIRTCGVYREICDSQKIGGAKNG